MTDPDTARELADLRRRVADLETNLGVAERLGGYSDLPDSMLFSDSFLKRAFAVLGHYVVASLIVMVPIYLVIFLIAALVGASL